MPNVLSDRAIWIEPTKTWWRIQVESVITHNRVLVGWPLLADIKLPRARVPKLPLRNRRMGTPARPVHCTPTHARPAHCSRARVPNLRSFGVSNFRASFLRRIFRHARRQLDVEFIDREFSGDETAQQCVTRL